MKKTITIHYHEVTYTDPNTKKKYKGIISEHEREQDLRPIFEQEKVDFSIKENIKQEEVLRPMSR
jgi:hypothetical protein